MSSKGANNIVSAEPEKIEVSQNTSIKIGKYQSHYFTRPWHYHPEFELLLITKGYGTRMVGDHFEPFEEGDIVLLGGNLPHAWISAPHFFEDNEDTCESIYIQFKKTIFGSQFIDIPELASVRNILAKAQRGLKINGHLKAEISALVHYTILQSPIDQLITLIKVLDMIQYSDYQLLASDNYLSSKVSFKSKKMSKVHNYIMQHFKEEIDINSCASLVKMTPSSFCRFFKKQTNVTFSVYLHYIRINFAQKLLINTELPIKEIGFECGYVSIIYFNQKFKTTTGLSPNEFRKRKSGV
ncbi:AraC family transcriptional regulator [Labilibacter marinus]|uniref:AraC family transcriptional regulator n=1 Tax=Labilibacter marinus TaxID=1477105 RepID=UPI000832E81F|nr:AraC family transcriptional regulator [Labilibacter marinus]